MRPSLQERFDSSYIPEPNSGCWIWTQNISYLGYGVFPVAGIKTRAAHRISYQMHVGKIPKGLELDHLCRVRCCVNPHHLEPVTHAENIRRGLRGVLAPPPVTHCSRGHEYTPENTYWQKHLKVCITCRRLNNLKYKRRNIDAIRKYQKIAARAKRKRLRCSP